MRTRWIAFLAVLCALLAPSGASAESHIESGGAIKKLARGAVNVVTGWVEIPKRIDETAWDHGTAAGLTWGLLRGIGYAFVRTAAGFYEVVTFPVPAPPGYAPVIQPPFIFTRDSSH